MPLVQVRNVPEETVARLKARAKEKGITMAAYIRDELERLAERPTNAEIFERIKRERPTDGPTSAEIVAALQQSRASH